ncbi:MAG: LacI family DNA-binding transcriptional regulator [Caldilineaceae bacterium]
MKSITQRPTIVDVARHAGLSKSTVSRVLQGDAPVSRRSEERVWRSIAALGYEQNAVASSLRTDRTWMVMVITPDITNPFWAAVARGAQDRLETAGYSVVLANSDWDATRETQFLSTARRNRFDALLINPTVVTAPELLATGTPTVLLGMRNDLPDFDNVGSDTYGGVQLALTHLYQLGHRRIGFIRGQHKSGRGLSRQQAYQDFLAAHALPFDPTLIVEVPYELERGAQAADHLLGNEVPPTAIFAANDLLAIGAMHAAHERGLAVPHDLSIVGMDDIDAAAMTLPGLTTVAKPKYEIGRQAATFLLERVEQATIPAARRLFMSCHLVVRGSTAAPRFGVA